MNIPFSVVSILVTILSFMLLRFLLTCFLMLPTVLPAAPSVLQALPTVSVTPYVPADKKLEALLAKPFIDYYGVYSTTNQAKFGWMSYALETPVVEGSRCIRLTEISDYDYAIENIPTRQRTQQVLEFSAKPPHALLRASYESTIRKVKSSVSLVRIGTNEYRAVIKEAGESRTREFSNLQLTALDRLGPRMWVRDAPRQRGDCQTFRGFDLKTLEPYSERHCILQPATTDGPAEVEIEDLKDRFRSQYRLDAAGHIQFMTIAGATQLVLETAEQAKLSAPAIDIIAASLIPCNRPLGPNDRLPETLRFTLTGPGLREIPNTRFQRVTLNPTGAEASIVTGSLSHPPIPATAEEMKVHLQSTAQLPLNDPRVKSLARKAVGRAANDRDKVLSLLAFVSQHIKDDPSAKAPTIIGLLKNPKGDCTAHALLFTALARAAGLPCRETSGYIYLGDAAQAFGGHAWNEVVIDGKWHPVDPTFNEFILNPTHIQLSSGRPTPRDAPFFNGQVKLRLE